MQSPGRLDRLIVFEGIDGAGTTTQARLLAERIRGENHGVWETSEPTGNEIGLLLRSVLAGDTVVTPETVAYLFAADRFEHMFGTGGILEHHSRNEIVVCDRYKYSSHVYQSIECDPALVMELNKPFPDPACIVFVDLDTEVGAQRLSSRSRREIYETLTFQDAVREKYLQEMDRAARSTTVIRVTGSDSESDVHRNIWEALGRTSIL